MAYPRDSRFRRLNRRLGAWAGLYSVRRLTGFRETARRRFPRSSKPAARADWQGRAADPELGRPPNRPGLAAFVARSRQCPIPFPMATRNAPSHHLLTMPSATPTHGEKLQCPYRELSHRSTWKKDRPKRIDARQLGSENWRRVLLHRGCAKNLRSKRMSTIALPAI